MRDNRKDSADFDRLAANGLCGIGTLPPMPFRSGCKIDFRANLVCRRGVFMVNW